MAKAKNLDTILYKEGWEILPVIQNNNFKERLVEIALGMAQGRYSEVKIIPASMVNGAPINHNMLETHYVFVKRSQKCKDYLNNLY
jgi:hypothetical protein